MQRDDVLGVLRLVTVVAGASGTVVEKDQDAIVQWYLRRTAAE